MKILFLLFFATTMCFAQPHIKSIKDIPLLTKGYISSPIKVAKQILSSKLITQPDTTNNEWEKYTINYINLEEKGHYAYDYWKVFEQDPWYWDTITYRRSDGVKNLSLTKVLFQKVLQGDTSIVCLSYDGKYKLTAEDITNMNRFYPDAPLEETFYVQTPNGKKVVATPIAIDYLEIKEFIVIEKTIRTKQQQVVHKLMAIAPYLILEDEYAKYKGHKLLCWFILPQ